MRLLSHLLIGLIASMATSVRAADETEQVDYIKQIKPILTKHCISCHGIDKHQSGYRLDVGELAIQGGDRGTAVVAGDVDASILMQAITEQGDVARMPLDKPPLAAAQIDLIRRWIQEGAEYPESEKVINLRQLQSSHWAFQPIVRPPLPKLKRTAWVRNSIDAFILSRLEAEQLTPSPTASRETLIRRLSLDLRGISPTVEEIDLFLGDARPDAYQQLVERMLSSPKYGERWGRHWLDIARYADSDGFTIDGPRNIWKYRDWVIHALNADYDFRRFTIEQLAGDMLDNPTTDQLVATGFHRNTLINQEGGTDDEQFRVEAVVDRVNTVGSAYLGLTVGCAQCHQHKYDPITQRDFYRLYALFNSTEDKNDANASGPIIPVPSSSQQRRRAELIEEIAAAEAPLAEHDKKFVAGLAEWARQRTSLDKTNWQLLDPISWDTAKGALLNKLDDKSLLVDFSVPANDTYIVNFETTLKVVRALRLEVLTNPSLPSDGPGRAENGNFVLSEIELLVQPLEAGEPSQAMPVKLSSAIADHSQEGYAVSDSIDGKQNTGWAISVKTGSTNINREAIYFPAAAIESDAGVRLTVKMHHNHRDANYLVGCFRIWVSDQSADLLSTPAAIREIAAIPAEERSEQQRGELDAAYKLTDTGRVTLASRVASLKKEQELLINAIPTTMVLRELSMPRESFIQIRGDFLRPGAQVTPGVPIVLPPLATRGKQADRLDFANWLTSTDNPLTARVTVNRFWQRFFGIGIVETENDFGTQGIAPEHPELLDWLASEFMRLDWGIKDIHRVIVSSATYRQSSHMSAELLQRDPRNKLLARQSRIRLEAEIIRDTALAASGLLSDRIGGPGVYPPQPEGIYILTQQKKAWPESQGGNRFRRTMYTYFWRSSPYPLMPTFDAPGSTTTCTQRTRSNTPLQALMLANDRGFFEIAQGLASEIVRLDISQDEQRLVYAFRRALSRVPSDLEMAQLIQYYQSQKSYYEAAQDDAKSVAPADLPAETSVAEAAAWTAVARVLFNLDEFITRE